MLMRFLVDFFLFSAFSALSYRLVQNIFWLYFYQDFTLKHLLCIYTIMKTSYDTIFNLF